MTVMEALKDLEVCGLKSMWEKSKLIFYLEDRLPDRENDSYQC